MFIKVTAVYFNEESKEFKMRLDNGAEYTSYDMPTGSCWVTNWKKEEDPKPRLNQDWQKSFDEKFTYPGARGVTIQTEDAKAVKAFIQDLLDEQKIKTRQEVSGYMSTKLKDLPTAKERQAWAEGVVDLGEYILNQLQQKEEAE